MTAPGSPIPRPAGPIGGKYDVTWHRSSLCSGGGCVEAVRSGELVLVRDSKLKDESPVQEWSVADWTDVLKAIKQDTGPRPWEWVESFAKVRLTHRDVALTFTAAEWDVFVAGVLMGNFEPNNLVPAAPRLGAGAPADEVAAASGHEAAAETEAGGNPLSPPASVAPPNGAPIDFPAGVVQTVEDDGPDESRHQPGTDFLPLVVTEEVRSAIVDLVRPDFLTGVDVDDWAREWAEAAFAAGIVAALDRSANDKDYWAKAIAPLVPPLTDSAPSGSASGREQAVVAAAACSCPGCGTGSCGDCSEQCTAAVS